MNNTSFWRVLPTFWPFWPLSGSYRAPLTQIPAEPRSGPGHFVIVYVLRAHSKKNIESVTFKMIVFLDNFLLFGYFVPFLTFFGASCHPFRLSQIEARVILSLYVSLDPVVRKRLNKFHH